MHIIYHIPGIKIGCTKNLKKRMKEQGFTNWEILEEHEDGWLAGDREIELQKEYGLPVDRVHYMITLQRGAKGAITRGQSDNNFKQYTTEQWKEFNKNNGGFLAKLTFEQAEEIRAKYTGEWGQMTKLSKEYGITLKNVSNIITNKSYTKKRYLEP